MVLKVESPVSEICLERCQGACCQNVTLLDLPRAQFDVLAGDSKKTQLEIPDQVFDAVYHVWTLPKGLYYADTPAGMTVGIKGRCPNLGEDFRCRIYPIRPNPCKNLPVEGHTCLQSRKYLNLGRLWQ